MTTASRSTDPCHEHSLRALFAEAGLRPAGGTVVPDIRIRGLVDDSRQVVPGGCFVAVRGVSVDGHAFVDAAVDRGAAVVVVEREVCSNGEAACVRVEDSREAIAKLAAAYYGVHAGAGEFPRLIGITGTNGKTTVAWLLRSILTAAGQPAGLLGTIEYDLVSQRLAAPLTTPGALELCRHLAAARDAGAKFSVLEVSSHALDQRRCDGLAFAATVFTNLSGDHLDYHGTMEVYAAAKRRLFDLRTADGVAVVNVDDSVGRSLAEELKGVVVTYAIKSGQADVTARILEMDRSGSRLTLCTPAGDSSVRFPLLGRHNVENALAAAATAEAFGIDRAAILQGLEQARPTPGRLQRCEPDGCAFTVLVDYAHTDAALANALEAVRPITGQRLICVFGCGGDRDRGKRPRMASAVGKLADVAYVTSDNPRTEPPQAIIDEILPGFGPAPTLRIEVDVDRRQAIRAAIGEARPGDTVLIAGKGHETYQLVGDRVLDFDDVQIARECLQATAIAEEVA